jgi:putative transposase
VKKTRFTEAQMVSNLREADQEPVPEAARKHGVSAQTIDCAATVRSAARQE